MAYIKLDDRFPDHPKVVAAGPEAAYLFVAGICYCNRYLTDGFIPSEVVPRLVPYDGAKVKQLVSNLLAACLWVASTLSKQNGFMVHDYADYQSSKAQILITREARKKAGQIGGKGRSVSEAKVKQNANRMLAKEEGRRKKEKEKEPPLTPPDGVVSIPLKGDAPARKKKPQKTKLSEGFIARMVQEYAEVWSETKVQEIIAQALNHTAVHKALDVELYVQGWLRRDAEKLAQGGNNGKFRGDLQTPAKERRTPDPKRVKNELDGIGVVYRQPGFDPATDKSQDIDHYLNS